MSDATYLTLQNMIPASFGPVTYFIQDKTGKQTNISVPALGSVQHPTDSTNGPWAIYATINSAGTGSSLSTLPWTFADPNAVVPAILTINLNPAVNGAAHAIGSVSAARSGGAGFTPLLQPSQFENAQGWQHLDLGDTPDLTTPEAATLKFAVQPQKQTQWCWAALATSMVAYYKPATSYTQCVLANWAFGQSSCCKDGSGPSCNRPYSVAGGINHVECLDGPARNGRLGLDEVRAQIAAGKPIGIRVLWKDGSASVGHALSIFGYDARDNNPDNATIDISDPWSGEHVVNLKQFPGNYQSGESWTHTYLTKAPS